MRGIGLMFWYVLVFFFLSLDSSVFGVGFGVWAAVIVGQDLVSLGV